MALQTYKGKLTPQQGDKVMWNWRKGTPATIIGKEGKQFRIAYTADITTRQGVTQQRGTALVFASSLQLVERPQQKVEAA